ncbi:unnamed protein product [Rhizoctonia solani]|uniref:RING-type domain-containing protein n=1 Tax=Rhizoctonia solani TaxID=456999 RepID=A0A8H3DC31_9AGAM|nr:unnamed protein product [Rhizoctonia solani]CAE7230829.1 unnamed protein product [Rhizoctonia solani]
MPSRPHLICSICETNVDTCYESENQQLQNVDNEETKTWLILCGHVICNSCYTSVVHASKRSYLCKHCNKKYKPGELDPQRIFILDTVPPVVGESRGLKEVADRLIQDRNKLLREGSKLLERFKMLQDEVEKADAKLESLLDDTFGQSEGFTSGVGGNARVDSSMQGAVDATADWEF